MYSTKGNKPKRRQAMTTSEITKKAIEIVALKNNMTTEAIISGIKNKNMPIIAAVNMLIELEGMR
jgi:hypothetical protein